MGAIENGIEAAASVADTAYALAQVFPNRNRLTNGSMQIDQRRGGTAVTNTTYAYLADHFVFYTPSTPGTVNLQQVVDGPPGVSQYSGKLTVNTVDSSISAAKRYGFGTGMEGLEIADLAWGTANARPIVVSFYVKSSLTGTHPFALGNGDFSRSYVVNFTVNAANTWERKSFVVPGDQSGTWLATNALAFQLEWSTGRGSNFQTATLGAWQTGNYKASTTALNLIATAGATFQISGVQFETGTTVTPFEYRLYGDDLTRCMRYFQIVLDATTNQYQNIGSIYNSTRIFTHLYGVVTMRAVPSVVNETARGNVFSANSQIGTNLSISTSYPDVRGLGQEWTGTSGTAGYACHLDWASGRLSLSAEIV
jgi:hypothetical protein